MDRYAYLVCVTSQNNNKFYRMELRDSALHCYYGRVGGHETHKEYSPSKWNSVYNKRIKKGYTDVTNLRDVQEKSCEWKPETGPVATISADLRRWAGEHVKQNYTVGAANVTAAQVQKAQTILNGTASETDVGVINAKLCELYVTIPRKMGKVQDHLITEIGELPALLKTEQDTLDTMAASVRLNTAQVEQTDDEPALTALQAIGVNMRPARTREIAKIKTLLGRNERQFRNAWFVMNTATQTNFDGWLGKQANKQISYLWHGSHNQNWWPILDTGLVIRPSAANGRAFGNGVYFANVASKSIGYVNRGRAFLGLFSVHTGNAYPLTSRSWDDWYSRCDYKWLRKEGDYDCLHAQAGNGWIANDELIVYHAQQVTINFLVEISR